MKILVVHDKKGNISSFAVLMPKARGKAMLEPQRGQFVSEVDVPGIKRTTRKPEAYLQKLSKIVKSHRVERGPKQARLVRR